MQGPVLIYITCQTCQGWHYGWAGRRTRYPLSLLECFHRTVSASCKEIANRNGNFASKWFVFAMNIHLKIRLTRINETKKKLHDVFVRPMHMYFTCHQLVFDHPVWLCDTVRSAVRRQQLELPQYRVPSSPPDNETYRRHPSGKSMVQVLGWHVLLMIPSIIPTANAYDYCWRVREEQPLSTPTVCICRCYPQGRHITI
jgi:hypothetical protein